ncbi:MAG: phosphoribosyltransferase [Actinomycetota bacterium]
MNVFTDRREAGRELTQRLIHYKQQDVVVVAIPRGGVIVASEVAKGLNAPLDLVIPRKIGAPGNPELAIGAVAGKGKVMLNEELKEALRVPDEYVEEEVNKQIEEINRRRKKYLGNKPAKSLQDKVVILVDDGLATGYTALAAISAIREEKPRRMVLAVPVAPRDTFERLKGEVDEIICLDLPEFFYAVGQFYLDFSQTTDEEVIEILKENAEKLMTNLPAGRHGVKGRK